MSEYLDGIRRIEKTNSARVLRFSLEKLDTFQDSLDKSAASLAKLEGQKLEVEAALTKLNSMISDEIEAQRQINGQIAEINVAIANSSLSVSGVAPRGFLSPEQVKKAMADTAAAAASAIVEERQKRETVDFSAQAAEIGEHLTNEQAARG